MPHDARTPTVSSPASPNTTRGIPMAPEILRGIDDCSERLGLRDPRSPEALEACAAFYVLQHMGLAETAAAHAIDKVNTGGANDSSLDAIAFVINGQLLTPDNSEDEIDAALTNEHAEIHDVIFVFVQVTGKDPGVASAPNLVQKMRSFLFGVQGFLSAKKPGRQMNAVVSDWINFKNYVFKKLKSHPGTVLCSCRTYLVWPRRWK